MISEMMPKTKELAEQLKKIGFRLAHCGCDHYRVVNQFGNKTRFEVFDDRVKVVCQLFGKKGGGAIAFNMRDCTISYDEDHNMVSIMGNDKESVFISFYGKRVK